VVGEAVVEGVALAWHLAVALLAVAAAVAEDPERAGVGGVVEAGVAFEAATGADVDTGLEARAGVVDLVEGEVGALEVVLGRR
jgi:hypothetical protein